MAQTSAKQFVVLVMLVCGLGQVVTAPGLARAEQSGATGSDASIDVAPRADPAPALAQSAPAADPTQAPPPNAEVERTPGPAAAPAAGTDATLSSPRSPAVPDATRIVAGRAPSARTAPILSARRVNGRAAHARRDRASARQVPPVGTIDQCNNTGTAAGDTVTCTVTVTNNFAFNAGIPAGMATIITSITCTGMNLVCPAGMTTLSATPVTLITQCNGAVLGGGGTLTCTATVTNNLTGYPIGVTIDSTVMQCQNPGMAAVACTATPIGNNRVGSGGPGGQSVTQCNGSGVGGGTVTCTVTAPQSQSTGLPTTISQCNGSGNTGATTITCTATITNNFIASIAPLPPPVVPPPVLPPAVAHPPVLPPPVPPPPVPPPPVPPPPVPPPVPAPATQTPPPPVVAPTVPAMPPSPTVPAPVSPVVPPALVEAPPSPSTQLVELRAPIDRPSLPAITSATHSSGRTLAFTGLDVSALALAGMLALLAGTGLRTRGRGH